MKNILKKLILANKYQQKVDSLCNEMADELQEFFLEDITVDYNPSDGFVVVYDEYNGDGAPLNIRVSEVALNISSDKLYYRILVSQ